MADTREQIVYPFRVGPAGAVVTADQGSDADISSCMVVVLKWPIGTRLLDEDFGVPEEAFMQNGASLDEIRDALAHGEPRATEDVTQDDAALLDFVSSVNVAWSVADTGAS